MSTGRAWYPMCDCMFPIVPSNVKECPHASQKSFLKYDLYTGLRDPSALECSKETMEGILNTRL